MNSRRILICIVLAILCYFPIFLHLDSEALFHWDEARNALNALEMDANGRWLVRYYQGAPETWETKPPLLVWFQVICFKIVGYNELAIRLPSALAAVFTLFIMVRFFIKDLKDFTGGCFAALALITASGYIDFHVVRTGDHDALLTFFQTLVLIYAYKYIQFDKNQGKHLLIVSLALLLTVFTKSIMGLIMLPGILVFSIFKKKLIPILKDKKIWLSITGVLVCIGSYYLIREVLQPGYLELVWGNELFPRYFNVAEGHNYKKATSYWYYFQLIATKQFAYFAWALPILVFILVFKHDQKIRNFGIYLLICSLSFLFLISGGTTNSWYDAPVFPLLAMLTGMGLSYLLKLLLKYLSLNSAWKKYAFSGLFVLTAFSISYINIIQKVYSPDRNQDKYGKLLKHMDQRNFPKEVYVYYTWKNSSFMFYEKVYRDIKGWDVQSCGVRGSIENCEPLPKIGQQVMICKESFIRDFEELYDFETLQVMGNCRLYRVKRKRGE